MLTGLNAILQKHIKMTVGGVKYKLPKYSKDEVKQALDYLVETGQVEMERTQRSIYYVYKGKYDGN